MKEKEFLQSVQKKDKEIWKDWKLESCLKMEEEKILLGVGLKETFWIIAHIKFIITIGSARAKGSSTSQALSELARRREEKNKVRSKRGRSSEAPSSPDKRRRKRYESDYENSAEESPLSEDESEKKVIRASFDRKIYNHAHTCIIVQEKNSSTRRNAISMYFKKHD